jgi:DmsE family decaheme c-type cytochrome
MARILTTGTAAAVLLTLALFCSSGSLLYGAVELEVEDETCLMCHDGYDADLAASAHRLSSQVDNPLVTIGCISCHPGGAEHIDDPMPENIGRPQFMTMHEINGICAGCHQPHTETGTVGFDPHMGLDINCVSCHSIHSRADQMLRDTQSDLCGKCHVDAVSQFRLRTSHPVADGYITCISCHDFTGTGAPGFGHGGNVNCFTCHPEQSGPYRFEHQATSSFVTEGHGCIGCHQPHGSPNDRLLNQPTDRLCFQCHGYPPGHRVAHDGIAEGLDCMECHSAVHGSHDNPALLDPMLGTAIGGEPGGCFCHGVLD